MEYEVPIQKGKILPSYETYKNQTRPQTLQERREQIDMYERNKKLDYETPKR